MEKELIKQILLEQREEISCIFKDNIIQREKSAYLSRILGSNLIKVIMGVRRCGKSVLAHLLLKGKDYGYINFDDERFIGIKSGELNNFLEELKEIGPGFKYLFLDEIQNIEGWELFVNRLKRMGYNFIITGSNSRLLSRELAAHLTGRYLSAELYPFSFREFLKFKNTAITEKDMHITEKRALIKRMLNEYLEYGGFPEVFNAPARGNYLRELYDKTITRDIVSRYNIKYVRDLKEIALYAISNFSSRFSYNKIKKIFEIKSVHTIKSYINYLEEAYLLFQVNNFSYKLKEQFKQAKKIYCIDTGMIQSIVPRASIDYGRLIENVVFLELKRQDKEVYFYSKPDFEVDFLIKEGRDIKQLIQVCYSTKKEGTKKREVKTLLTASKQLRCNNLLVITWDEERQEKTGPKTITFTPLWKWLLIA